MTKLKVKRGVESNRTNITPEQGELIVTTDTNNIYVGDGTTPGGNLVGLLTKEWNIDTTINQTTYTLKNTDPPFRDPANGIYLVFLSGVKVVPGDFLISTTNNSITLNTPPKEENEILSIFYIGK